MAAKKFTRVARRVEAEAVRDHIEEQRTRLMEAEALLDCLILAIEDGERLHASVSSFPSVVCVVRVVVRAVIGQLDSVKVKAVVTAADVSAETLKDGGVRDEPAAYIH